MRIERLCLFVLLALCLAPASAQGLEISNVSLQMLNGAGEPETQAGAHPDRLLQSLEIADPEGTDEEPRDLVVDLPAGLSGNPGAVPLCPRAVADEFLLSGQQCPAESQIGILTNDSVEGKSSTPLYGVEPAPNEAVLISTQVLFPLLKFRGHLRAGDQGLSIRLADLAQSARVELSELRIELWGIPADHQEGTDIPRKPFLTLPTRCEGPPLSATVSAHTWQRPERWFTGVGDTGQRLVGCESLPFDPKLGLSLDAPRADSPSGAEVELRVPQPTESDAPVSSQVRDLSVALPAGMTLSPGGAAGLAACTDAQLGLGSDAQPSCPPTSRVGNLELDVPSLAKPMTGQIYLASERPGERFRLLMAAAAAGSQVKFAGALVADPLSGQLTAKLRNLPEASFKRMSLDFDGGPGALLATPLECGPATATATLVPYSATPPVNRGATVSVEGSGGACTPVRFAPSLIAGSTKAKAGSPTAFTATVHRADGEAVPERLTLTLPPGMGAALGSVSRCQPTAAGACPPSSRVGATVAELGPGPNPAQIKGEIYLTGPYRHAPFGLLLSFAAKLGPFDLGTLSVRAALRIDPQSGRVSIATDRLPTVFEGLLIRFQSIGLDLDRPGFIRNPTSCQASKVAASLSSANGSQARPSTPFLIRGCIDLPFRPQLSMALSGPAPELRKGGKPSLAVETRIPKGHANLRSLQIRFPKLLTLDTSGLREICARTDALRGECPKGSEVGRAAARSPLLAKAMRGEVYLAQPQDNGPPDLWVDLEGEGIEVSLRGETAVEDGRLLTRFARLPDFALSALALRFDGGGGGVLELGRGGCGRSLSALGEIGGQNGARVKDRVAVGVRGGCGERQG